MAWGSPVQAASRPRCSAAHRRSAHRGTYTGTYSWGRRSGHSDRRNRPEHTHRLHELEGRYTIWEIWCLLLWLYLFIYTYYKLNHLLFTRSTTDNRMNRASWIILHNIVSGCPLTGTDTGPPVDLGGVFTLQPLPCVAGVHFRADLPFLTGTHQAADAVIQDQRHPWETHGGLLRALASPRAHLGADYCKHLGGRQNELVFYC